MSDGEGNLPKGMSIARLISRFSSPRLMAFGIPTYRHSFSLPTRVEHLEQIDKTDGPALAESDSPRQEAPQVTDPSNALPRKDDAAYVEWSKILPVPSSMLSSFSDLFKRHSHAADAEDAEARPPPRLTFFGEQHHQPQVMRAQLQTLHALHEQCQAASDRTSTQNRDRRGDQTPRQDYQLHLILEHFSVLDQPMLSSFSRGESSPQQLADHYISESEEGFQIGHYMPLLMLARELKVPIWGGFPPRSWARQVFRDGVDAVKESERARVQKGTESAESNVGSASVFPGYSPLFTSWTSVSRLSAAHRSYLSSLMRPDMPPRFPELPDEAHGSLAGNFRSTSAIYPTWLLKPSDNETKGFGPAQALKDSYLAHVTAWILRGAKEERPPAPVINDTSSSRSDSADQQVISQDPSSATDRPVVNIALVVCGLGHCEYGFGAPERVVDLLRKESDSSQELTKIKPYIIASKPLDSGIWLGFEHALDQEAGRIGSAGEGPQSLSDGAIIKDSKKPSQSTDQWLQDAWGRSMADAVLLYDWVDEDVPEPQPEPQVPPEPKPTSETGPSDPKKVA